ncbi:MAG: hypothetical protein C0404_13285 [Verrucomicrobia bacterium]|nr:hypothetical protein [Verrucomicrobiota bacterium]
MKVLILHASAGAGHKRAAEALARAFPMEKPGAEVVVRDILDFTNPVFKRTYSKGYLDVVKRAPELWGYMYAEADRKADSPWRKKVRTIFNRIQTLSFRRFFNETAPDVVVCTHFMSLELLSARKLRGKTGVPLFCVVTDFAVHALWVVENVDGYFVACEEAKRQLLRKGQKADRVTVSGIPIDPVFSKSEPPQAVRERLGLEKQMPTALVLSGGFGVGPTVDLIKSFRGSDFQCQLLVVAGANKDMEREATAAARGIGMPARVFGFVNNVHELMDASDVIISKPGGLTTSEAMAKGKPMIVVDPIPGQEQRNCEYLLEAGAALRLYEADDAPFKIKALLGNPERLAAMTRNALKLGHPHAAKDIAKAVLAKID